MEINRARADSVAADDGDERLAGAMQKRTY
jgi:hypothetical protein